jgi:Leucine-rich repeat (LRR) protein
LEQARKTVAMSNSYVPNLKTLHLNSNYISLLSNFKCLPSLSFLSLQDNSIEEIPEEAFSNLFSLKELNLQSMKLSDFRNWFEEQTH